MLPPSRHSPPSVGTKRPPHLGQTTHTPDIRNTTMPPHTGKGESDFWFKKRRKSFFGPKYRHLSPGVYCGVFALRCGTGSSSGSRIGHGSDGSHLDCGLCLALEEQVCIFICL